MFRNYLLVAFRQIVRHPGYAAIHVAGLGVGLAAALLILLFVTDELSYDDFQRAGVVRITETVSDESGATALDHVLIDPGWQPLLASEVPEIEAVVRLTPVGPVLSVDDRRLGCEHCYWVDPGLFDVLSVRFLHGDPATALSGPGAFVLSRSRAEALYGTSDAVGRPLTVNGNRTFTVTGVFEDPGHNTHLPIDGVGTLSTFAWFNSAAWQSPNYATYARLAPGSDRAVVEAKLAALVARHREPSDAARISLHVQPVRDIHLRSALVGELGVNGSFSTVAMLAVVAFFILAIACINFMNLSTARSSLRAREVGVRKANGAVRSQLVGQFLGESVLLVFVALGVAMLLVQAVLPAFNSFTGKDVSFLGGGSARPILMLIATGLLTAIVAGSYPAFFLSAKGPIEALRGDRGARSKGFRLRSALVVLQFAVAIVLAVGTIAIFCQLAYVESRPLGFDRSDVLVLPVIWDLKENFSPVAARLEADPDIVSVAQSNPVPGSRLHASIEVAREDAAAGRLETVNLFAVWADQGFFETYGIEVRAGRNFAEEYASDTDSGFILNETAVRTLSFADNRAAVGAPLRVGGWRGQVIGVVADVHFESLHQPLAPQVYYMDPRNYRAVSVRVRPGADLPAVVRRLESEWTRSDPGSIFTYSVLDDRLRELYDGERRLGHLIGIFGVLALFVTCLGVLGLAAFAAARRTREIGVRKVFGARSSSIVALLNRDTLVLVGIALVVALPLGAVLVGRWLDTFAYRVGLPWWVYLAVAAGFVAVAVATVSVLALRAASADPVQSLRYE